MTKTTKTSGAPLERYTTIAGEVLEYPRPEPELARFLARLRTAVEDPGVSESAIVELIYGSENPLLDHTIFKGRGAVTREVFANPLYHVMTDLLDAKRVQVGTLNPERAAARYTMTVTDAAAELGISTSAVRQAIERGQLSSWKANPRMHLLDPETVRAYRDHVVRRGPRAAPALSVRMGNKPGASFRVKAPELEVVSEQKLEGGGKMIDAVVPKFARVAIVFSGKSSNRMFVLEPSDEGDAFEFNGFEVRGKYRVAEKINDPEEASKRFRAFRAE